MDSDVMYEQLLRDIQWGQIAETEFIREVDLAERFGVSRTPIRDVLNRLVHDGLLERTPKGLRVRPITPVEIMQTYDLRILLEAESAAQAALHRHDTDLMQLKRLLNRDRVIEDPSDAVMTESNLEFHAAVLAAAHNPILESLHQRLSLHLIHRPSSTLSLPGRWKTSLEEHESIVEAIAARDETSARNLMTAHMGEARRLRLTLFAK